MLTFYAVDNFLWAKKNSRIPERERMLDNNDLVCAVLGD